MSDATTFPIRKVNALRLRARRISEVEMEGPEEGCYECDVDPTTIIEVFDNLHLKAGYTLWACQHRSYGDGRADVWAIPDDGARPEKVGDIESPQVDPTWPTLHYGSAASKSPMEMIEGDGTPWSYLCASLLSLELAEFGAEWHGCWWGTHTILGEDPFLGDVPFPLADALAVACFASAEEWEWEGQRPVDWSPCVRESEGSVTVQFYTYSALGTASLYLHTDEYRVGSYVAIGDMPTIATGPGGMLF
jgi:hypothetical protein